MLKMRQGITLCTQDDLLYFYCKRQGGIVHALAYDTYLMPEHKP